MKKSLSEMSADMESMKIESDFIETKHREMALMKLQIQDELNNYKRECDGLREHVTRFSEEQKLAHDRAKRQEERYAKLLENFTKVENDKREVILQLKVSSTDLKSAKASKRRAEAEVEAWKKKFGELELRIFRLEQDTATLVIGDPLSKEKIDMDMQALDEDLGAGLSMERNWRPESGAIIQINDSDDELPAVHGRTCVSNICDSGTILSQKKTNSQKSVEGAHFGQTGEENGGRGMQNHFLVSTPKRKHDSSTDICDSKNDDDYKFVLSRLIYSLGTQISPN
ncbi:hypothetical protein F0562_035484 [Nyssa sinensis]|uniref:Uncharacterized protein n=1 Tax=Nyssa sinensis TaxID=561372 RepID=A0A5J5AB64_9ASTE|nr:hypothetical protein F0562_035484 [Nyssa sinensis]